MSYYLRAFCTSAELPSPSEVLAWVGSQGIQVEVEDLPDDWNCDDIPITYKPDKQPFLLELNVRSGQDSLCEEEIEEFIELLDDVEDSKKRKRVLEHLQATEFVAACQLLTSDLDDDGYDAAGTVMHYFVEHCGGMVQADGEGFYDGENLLIEC